MGSNEALARKLINDLLEDQDWDLEDAASSVELEAHTPKRDGRADYLLKDRNGRPLAVVEAKREGLPLETAGPQALRYAEEFGLRHIFVSNGRRILYRNLDRDAHLRDIQTFFSQKDLERRANLERDTDRDLLAEPVDKTIADRPYQLECIDAVCREWKRGMRKFLVEMATGTGKTRTTIALIKRLFDAQLVRRVLWLNDRVVLAKQTDEAFRNHWDDKIPHLFTGGRGRDDHAQVVVSLLQTMNREYENYSSGFFDLVVVDECHRSIYGDWRRILKHFDARWLGLTATPFISDPNELAFVDDKELLRDTYEFFKLKEPTYQYSLKQGIKEKFLVPYSIYSARTIITEAEEGYPVRHEDIIDWESMDDENRRRLEDAFAEKDEITLEPRMLERVYTVPQRNEKIAQDFHEVFEQGFTGRDGNTRRLNPQGKTIVFAVTKQHAATLARLLDDLFAHRKPPGRENEAYADFVVSQDADGAQATQAKIKKFRDEDLPRILVSVDMLDAGFDLSTVTNLVMVRLTRSTIKYQQMRGRGTRPNDKIAKDSFVILDYVGVCDLHKDDEPDPLSGGAIVQNTERRPTGTPRGLVELNIPDEIDPSSRGWIAINEEGDYEYTSEQEVANQKFRNAFELWLKAIEQEMGGPFGFQQERILRMIESQLQVNMGSISEWDESRLYRPPFTNVPSGFSPEEYYPAIFGGRGGLRAVLESLNRFLRERAAEKGRE